VRQQDIPLGRLSSYSRLVSYEAKGFVILFTPAGNVACEK